MNVFELRQQLIQDYGSFVKGFINIRDERINQLVTGELDTGALWPEPLLQISPFFAMGTQLEDFIAQGILHPDCARVFRIKSHKDDLGKKMHLYQHQAEAILQAHHKQNYVLTTGTGSGKSLSYIIPIVNHILASGSGKGIKAIIIYPMNALANSQEKELQKFINYGFGSSQPPASFRRYTGQESDDEKRAICENPPDILLTNYVMLELILTRPDEEPLVKACKNLKFLVLDELHTYRGRQGADVAMLIRRTKEATGSKDIICVGTSATLSSQGDLASQQNEISRIASLIFGSPVKPDCVISETLERITEDYDFTDKENISELQRAVRETHSLSHTDFDTFRTNHLAAWIESFFGISRETTSGRLVRSTPRSIRGNESGASELSRLTGIEPEACVAAIQKMLILGFQTPNPNNDKPSFAFRLHQFISRGDTVFASLEPPATRHISSQGQLYVPGSDKAKFMLPLAFCRKCGQEYYTVFRDMDLELSRFRYSPRDLTEKLAEEDQTPGFLYDPEEQSLEDILGRLPIDWRDERGKILSDLKSRLPEEVYIDAKAIEEPSGKRYLFFKAPFIFCPCCQVTYTANQRNDYAKLSSLGTEGRSTATTILSLSVVRHLRDMELPDDARKLLSFTDNRQDASLQAGHFNDFVRVSSLRGALYKALCAQPEGYLRYNDLSQAVFTALALDYSLYSSNPVADKGNPRERTDKALRDVLGYRLFLDLRRGWRVTAPNLEQSGLLEIEYDGMDSLAADNEIWQDTHPALAEADAPTRSKILKVLLDWMRRGLAIKSEYLSSRGLENICRKSGQHLIPPWGFDEHEEHSHLQKAMFLHPRSGKKNEEKRNKLFLSSYGSFAAYLRRPSTFPNFAQNINRQASEELIYHLISALCRYGIIEQVNANNEDPAYQLVAEYILWKAGSGERGYYDPTRQLSESLQGEPINEFFRDFYQNLAHYALDMEAREHTAQVSYEERERREEAFRSGALPILYCSPTMELGIDIAQLNVVNMRNIPPTPANYAQRSGRAGRSGQPALIFSYSSTGSPHDQYFYKRPYLMVSGAVATPQIDIANEDMLRSHIQAIWLSEARLSLGISLSNLLDLGDPAGSLPLIDSVTAKLQDIGIRQRAYQRAERVIQSIEPQLQDSIWYNPDWLAGVLNQIPRSFDNACERWRGLYKAAKEQQELQNRIVMDHSASYDDKRRATHLRSEAESQLQLLTSSGVIQSDFYSYRYFASEGFLPGYNFPRLPLSAFIPGRKISSGKDDYLSRPRFLAITEFGPHAIVYHEGSRYEVNRVILPAQDLGTQLSTSQAKLCPACGYLHSEATLDFCQNCHAPLSDTLSQLFRLQNVVAKRKDMINCDEEERLRYGFELCSSFHFATKEGSTSCQKVELSHAGEVIGTLSYGDSATIWRINMGHRRRGPNQQEGFWLDTERGYWLKQTQDGEEAEPEERLLSSRPKVLVRPYVSDTKNCLFFSPLFELSPSGMASLQAALKNAIQQVFELEDNELAIEPLPSRKNRRSMLFYEASEGGAGVLKQMLIPENFQKVLRTALELCHFDPDSHIDQKRGKYAKEDCEAACYDCLMSYSNQIDHALLDRHEILDALITLKNAKFSHSPSQLSRQKHYQSLRALTASDFERRWLDYIYKNDLKLPSDAQKLIESCHTRPDFLYQTQNVAIYLDGSPHDDSRQQAKDTAITECLENTGWQVVRFGYREDWQKKISEYPYIFGLK